MNRPIGILDSGIGGISILNQVVHDLPHENYIYYVDSIHNPYGNKTKEELIELMNKIMRVFMKKHVKLVIVACNTASTQVLSYLRENYQDILFVGVEPAIKVAHDYFYDKNVLVMATEGTVQSERVMLLDEKYHQEKRTILSCDTLANLIENQKMDQIPAYLNHLFEKINKSQIEVVVLGCTHYPLIKKEIEEAIGHPVIFIDGAQGVKKRVKCLLKENKMENRNKNIGYIQIILTKESTKEAIEKYSNFSYIVEEQHEDI